MCPLSFITYLLYILFLILQSSHLDDEDMKNPQPRPHENPHPQNGADKNQRLLVKMVIFKKTRTILIVLYYSIQYSCYASYCIALEIEEARERLIIQFIDLLSHWLSLKEQRRTRSPRRSEIEEQGSRCVSNIFR